MRDKQLAAAGADKRGGDLAPAEPIAVGLDRRPALRCAAGARIAAPVGSKRRGIDGETEIGHGWRLSQPRRQ